MESTPVESIPPSAPKRAPVRWLPLAIVAASFLVLGALLAFGIPFLLNGGITAVGGNSAGLNLKPAPDFTVPLYTGGQGNFTLSAQKGHPVVVNFWASWCPPCRAEFPDLQAAANTYSSQGIVFFGAAVQDNESDSRAFLAQEGTTYMTGPDPNGQITVDYSITGLPVTVFITPTGRIYKKWVGQIDEQHLNTFIQELLKQ